MDGEHFISNMQCVTHGTLQLNAPSNMSTYDAAIQMNSFDHVDGKYDHEVLSCGAHNALNLDTIAGIHVDNIMRDAQDILKMHTTNEKIDNDVRLCEMDNMSCMGNNSIAPDAKYFPELGDISIGNTKEEILMKLSEVLKENDELKQKVLKLEEEVSLYKQKVEQMEAYDSLRVVDVSQGRSNSVTEENNERTSEEPISVSVSGDSVAHVKYNHSDVSDEGGDGDDDDEDESDEKKPSTNDDGEDNCSNTSISDEDDEEFVGKNMKGDQRKSLYDDDVSVTVIGSPTCVMCGKSYKYQRCLRKHMTSSHPDQLCCSICGKLFGNRELLEEHREMHKDDGVFCEECGKRCINKHTLNKHMMKHREKKTFDCFDCGKNFNSEVTLKKHMTRHARGKQPYKCMTCGRSFKFKRYLVSHQYTHSEKTPYQCEVCNRHYTTARNLKDHLKKHVGLSKPFKCDECGETFARKVSVTRHKLRIHQGVPTQRYTCDICGNSYVNIKAHMHFHDDSFVNEHMTCRICGHKCKSKNKLGEHMLTHTGEKNYCCSICGKMSATGSNHKLHMRTHTGEKPYPCTVCEKRYPTAAQVRSHMMLHTGEKPFSCTRCGKSFRLRSGLKNHSLIHTGERPHSCDLCDQRFVQVGHRNTHMKLVHGKKHDGQPL